jgi:hypothetical protein
LNLPHVFHSFAPHHAQGRLEKRYNAKKFGLFREKGRKVAAFQEIRRATDRGFLTSIHNGSRTTKKEIDHRSAPVDFTGKRPSKYRRRVEPRILEDLTAAAGSNPEDLSVQPFDRTQSFIRYTWRVRSMSASRSSGPYIVDL